MPRRPLKRRSSRLKTGSIILLVVIAIALIFTRGGIFHHQPPPQTATAPAAAPVPDPRPLTQAEQDAFVPLVCGGSTPAAGQYQYHCITVPGYPDLSIAGEGIGISLTAITYGGITTAGASQAYLSYQASFESHADNFGGGVLFKKSGVGWLPLSWVPGGQLDGCLSLGGAGAAKFICDGGSVGQGEADSSLNLVTITPPGPGTPAGLRTTHLLTASDLRQTDQPNLNCTLRKSPDQAVLLSIDSLNRAPAPDFALAGITYVTAAAASAACAKNDFADAPTQTGTLHLQLAGQNIAVTPGLNFAPAEF